MPLDWRRVRDRWLNPSLPEGYTYVAKVPGGWLVSVWAGTATTQQHGGGVTFLPDPCGSYDWEFVKPKKAPRKGSKRRDKR